ncbi:MAG TPA: type II toxin-antitoxin system VapC family toxin, partial [Candidatus Methanoperedens sp.]|nr:type II toxin-antitoxin system VapC family toxin [Candidatus Methanoperedens sp.]
LSAEGSPKSNALEGKDLAAPTLLPYEIASICAKKIAARPGEERMLLEALELFPSLNVALHVVPLADAVSIARRRKLTTYDASYLWLAAEMGADLVTLDGTLARAWKRQRG